MSRRNRLGIFINNKIKNIKKSLLCSSIILFAIATALSQAPQKMNYQAVVRNSSGQPAQNQNVALRFKIHDLTPNGTVVFAEIQNDTTNQFGLVTVEIGSVSSNLAAYKA